jgi:folate-dependent phosphoribosylglycinamide formyltransferase PurN
MRIVFLAVDDEFAGRMQYYVYGTNPDWVVGSVISTCAIYKKSLPGAAWFLLRRCGFVYLMEMLRMKMLRRFYHRERKFLPSKLAQMHNVEMFFCADINADESIAKLKAWNPDIVVSTNFNQYIGKDAREVAEIGTWNLHKSSLPSYRGMAPNFYALLDGVKTVGATLHVVSKEFDTGDIIRQVEVPVCDRDSVYSLNKKTSEEAGKMLARLLTSIKLENLTPTSQPKGDWRTYSYPTKEHVRRFRKEKLRF